MADAASVLPEVLAWDDPEQVLRAIEGKPLVGSLWHFAPQTHLDKDMVARVEAYTPLGRLLLVHHLCEDGNPFMFSNPETRRGLRSGCGHEWVQDVAYVQGRATPYEEAATDGR